MKYHKIKILSEYLQELSSGCKKSEIRYNDRDYQKGDIIELYETFQSGTSTIYSGTNKPSQFKITHIHSGLGMEDGYIVLSLEKQ
tara:strand:+ start:1307 stop:1561 length:255 start_codon:yes stop_codon:yes gene_type:complete